LFLSATFGLMESDGFSRVRRTVTASNVGEPPDIAAGARHNGLANPRRLTVGVALRMP